MKIRSWLYVLPAQVPLPWSERPILQGSEQGVRLTTLAQLATQTLNPRQLVILPVEWALWCRGEAYAGRGGLGPASQRDAQEGDLASDPDSRYLVFASLDKRRCASAWVLDRGRFSEFQQALHQAGVDVERMVVDADLLSPDSPEALWLAGRWLVGGSLDVRLAVDESQRLDCAARMGPGLVWHIPGPDLALHDARVLQVLVERAAWATDLLQGNFRPRRSRLPRLGLAGLTLLLGFMPTGFDLYRAHQLEQAARRLDSASVAVYAQRSADQASLAMLGARLNAIQVADPLQQERAAKGLQQLYATAVEDRLAQVLSLEYGQGKWALEVQLKSFDDMDELQRRWQTLGFRAEVASARKSERGVRVQFNLTG
ncbi:MULTISPECIES: type II secretion system protein GspL [Pseudomonas]|uniref:type II secretion system protein GspL n=1 Tax=Pseudomonas TaxID=286 RepID=UPI002113E246|nr:MULTISPECIES: type II secretion system protein GspL [Pseudomonas]